MTGGLLGRLPIRKGRVYSGCLPAPELGDPGAAQSKKTEVAEQERPGIQPGPKLKD